MFARYNNIGPQPPWFSKYQEVFPFPFETEPDFQALTHSYDYGNIHVLSIDQYTEGDGSYDGTETSYGYCADETNCSSCSPHYEWLKQDLEAAKNRLITPFLIVIMHEPLYSAAGRYDNEVEPCFEKLLKDCGVDIVLAGHNEYYARAERYYNGRRTRHITTGGGGSCCHVPVLTQPYVRKVSLHLPICSVSGLMLLLDHGAYS